MKLTDAVLYAATLAGLTTGCGVSEETFLRDANLAACEFRVLCSEGGGENPCASPAQIFTSVTGSTVDYDAFRASQCLDAYRAAGTVDCLDTPPSQRAPCNEVYTTNTPTPVQDTAQ